MLSCHLKKWAVFGVAVAMGMLSCRGLALAYESHKGFPGDPYFQRRSNLPDTSFFLNFSQRYYRAVESSLQENSYFAFRYYLNSPFESFAKQQFISENPTQASDLAAHALQNAIRKTVEENELIMILRDYFYALTRFQMRIGGGGTQVHGPSLTRLGFQNSPADVDSNKGVVLNSGLTFAEDLRLGFNLVLGYHMITSKLSYYPVSRNEIGYTAETQVTASSKIGVSYHLSQDDNAVVTTFSYLF